MLSYGNADELSFPPKNWHDFHPLNRFFLPLSRFSRYRAMSSCRLPQTLRQREFEVRIKEAGTRMAKRLGISRRKFLQTAAGMATAFLAMNDTYGPIFGVSRAEAQTPEEADARAKKLSGQFIMDMHTHFLRPGTRLAGFINARKAVGKAGWNPELVDKEQTLDDLMFINYIKEIYLDSDTKVACISGAPSEIPEDWRNWWKRCSTRYWRRR